MPGGIVAEQLSSTYSGAGILTVSAPRVISAPEGAQVSEAMKAQSQALVTDDGVAVKKDDKASSQSMAATTQSEDGSTISSIKSSSSSSSSSTMMSSGGPMPGGMSMGGMPDMMSMGGGMGGIPSLGMDDMMGKMMSDMGSMNMNSSSSKMSSSSFSSSSSSSMMSSDMSSMMGGMPPMRGMQMPGLSFQEMPSMPASAAPSVAAPSVAAPEYTVTSPPMSPPPPEMSHKVQKTEDYVPPTTQTAEATVLLKVKEGDEYKLALNMQQYSPEDITIKLNGNELAIEAAGHGEQFKQKHIIPDNINLDAMSSSFSSDGVLVIKAPKK